MRAKFHVYSFVIVCIYYGTLIDCLLEQGTCNRFQYQCKNKKQCINEDALCNGKLDCKDGSDETQECHEITCPPYVFTCGYGACIDSDFICDGKKDCEDNSDEMLANCTTTSVNVKKPCTITQFQCKTNPPICIGEDLMCNGVVDCPDSSDETSETCETMLCPGYTFQCTYGACIDKSGRCNGQRDCADNSDEQYCGTTTDFVPVHSPVTPKTPKKPTLPTTGGNCYLPDHPRFGHWSVVGISGGNYQPGTVVAQQTFLRVACNSGYKAKNSFSFCEKGSWSMEIDCLQMCPPYYNSNTTTIQCFLNNAEVNCTEPLAGTIAKITCAPYYEHTERNGQSNYCRDGTWSFTQKPCSPVCGQRSAVLKPLVVNGTVAQRGTYPWNIAMYKKNVDDNSKVTYEFSCGGSLISSNIVISAAHCVTQPDGTKLRKDIFLLSAGKYHSNYSDPRDTSHRVSAVKDIIIPSDYAGDYSNYVSDIAVLILTDIFPSTSYIQPICLDYGENKIRDLRELIGVATGWGYTKPGGEVSETLREIAVPYIDNNECMHSVPDEYKRYIINKPGKMCGGYKNKGQGLCDGDSGSGLVFLNSEDNRYYLKGVVSTSVQTDGACDVNYYTIFTRVSSYDDFIIKTVEDNRLARS